MNCNKLLNQQDFIQLLDWEEHGYYASELLPMIHQIFPPAVPPSAQPSTPAQSNTVVQPCTKQCGNCKNMATMLELALNHARIVTRVVILRSIVQTRKILLLDQSPAQDIVN
ncbi:uncharacterized protein EI90DRAFT_3014738 [Cantharellus anzutake]|uniref:uncharacterized protein n=1 Tax=Cantharellus anzutake TaxID=1750568 RepID=UPI0019070459|nr:uncharacterized protein EI90DRAFT_3014738 [Cantharellus anzutake]KAF8334885.1 hypothetical protein EI90DRAFT_3014738 [Cantharellus anzutake]